MKKVGIIGGMGPESTVDYYKSIVSTYQKRTGDKENLPELLINSINMYKMFRFLEAGETQRLVTYLSEEVQKLAQMGADFAVLSANTPHIVFDEVQDKVQIPMISLVEETCRVSEGIGLNRLGLIGTKFTMDQPFFRIPFEKVNKEISVPDDSDRAYIHRKIVEELEHGIVNEHTKQAFLEVIHKMVAQDHIQGIILGCTELPMLIKERDLDLYQLNTTEIHVSKIVDTMLEGAKVLD